MQLTKAVLLPKINIYADRAILSTDSIDNARNRHVEWDKPQNGDCRELPPASYHYAPTWGTFWPLNLEKDHPNNG